MMEKLDAILPGVNKFIREILANEHLSPEVEKQRLHYVELLDVLNLRAPPRVPAPLPASATTGHGKPAYTTDLLAPTRSAFFSAGAGATKPIDEENVYNEVTDTEYSTKQTRRSTSIDSRDSGAYEEPLSIISHITSKQQPVSSVTADSAAEIGGGGSSEDSDTDYEQYREDDEDGEDGSELVAVPTEAGIASAAGSETILLPRVKSKKKKKSPVPDVYLKPYDALVGRQYEGEVYARSKLSWNRLYCAIAQNVLYFYKNRADLQPRFYLPLKGHDVLLMDKDKGRNNVLRISKPGTETLFVSCDTMEKANEWYKQVIAALSMPSNSMPTEDVTATAFYCSRDDVFSAAAAAGGVGTSTTAAHSTQPPIVRGSSDDGDYRPIAVSGDVAQLSGAATLPLSASHTIRAFAPEATTYPKAAPRKVAAAENKKKGKISKLFTGSTGRKKGRLTMDLMQDYSARRLSTDPDVVISGMLAVMSPNFGDGSSKWDEARCLIRTGGSFECSRCISADDPSPLTGEPSILLNLSECSVESSSDKGRPLALSLFKSKSLQLTFMPCDRMQHGDWLAALLKYVDRSSRPTTATSSSSSSSSASGSGDGIIQHVTGTSTATQLADKVPAGDQASAVGNVGNARLQTVVRVDGGAIGNSNSFAPLYINVDDVGKPALNADSESSDDDANYEEVDDGIVAPEPMQKVVVRNAHNSTGMQSGTICSSTAISVSTAARAGASVGVFAPSGWKSHTSSVTTSAACSPSAPGGSAAAGEPTAVTASPPPDALALPDSDGSGGGDRVDGGDETLSVQARILHAEAMARIARLSPVPTRTKDCTPSAAVSVATITATERTRPFAAVHAHPAPAGAPAASSQASLHVPAAATTGPFVHSQHSPTASALSATRYITPVPAATAATAEQSSRSPSSAGRDRVVAPVASGAAQQDGTQVGIAPLSELAPRKLAMSGGIAKNRAVFEASAATSSVAAAPVATTIATTTTAGSPAAAAAAFLGNSGKPNGKLAAASEPRWTGYKLAVAPAMAAGTVPAAASMGRARRQSSSGSDPRSPLSRAPPASVVASIAVGARGGSVCGGVGASGVGHSAATAGAAAVAANSTVAAAANYAVARAMPTDCQLDESTAVLKAYAKPIGDGVASAMVGGAAGCSNGSDYRHDGSVSVTASSIAGPLPQPRLVLISAAAGSWSAASLSPMPYSRPSSSVSAVTATPASAGGTGSITTYTTLSSINRRDPAPILIEPGKSPGVANSCCCGGGSSRCGCSGGISSSSCCTTATAVGPSDASRPTIAFADGTKKNDVRAAVEVTKAEARMAIGSMVGRLTAGAAPVAAAAVPTTSASVTVTVLPGSQITSVGAPSTAADDVRRAGADAESRQQLLEEHRQLLAELRKQRNQIRAGRAAAPVSERSRMEVEYRVLDDRCRELERLISELEDVNLMHIKAKRNAT